MNSKMLTRLLINDIADGQRIDFEQYLFDINIKRVRLMANILLYTCSGFLLLSTVTYLIIHNRPESLDIWPYIYGTIILLCIAFLSQYGDRIKNNEAIKPNGVVKMAVSFIYAAGIALVIYDPSGIDKSIAYYLVLILGTVVFFMPPAFTLMCISLAETVYIISVAVSYPSGLADSFLIINSILVSVLLFSSSRMIYRYVMKAYFAGMETQYKNRQLINTNQQLLRVNEKLHWLSTHDELTGIPNRLSLNARLGLMADERCMGVIMIDIDLFKKYNDMLGHKAGDDCLVKVARFINEKASDYGGFAARYGGEEFVVLIPGCGEEKLSACMRAIRDGVTKLHILHPNSYISPFVTVSVGASLEHMRGKDDMAALMKKADDALYEAKRTGRNGMVFKPITE